MDIAIRAINMRKLAAIDIVFLGRKLIIAEYAAGVFFSAALGLFVLLRGHSFWQTVLGIYLICLATNYIPMLLHALAISTQQNARVEMADELTKTKSHVEIPSAVPAFTGPTVHASARDRPIIGSVT